MTKKVRSDELTNSRMYGVVCEKHPELKGLRIIRRRKYIAAHDDVNFHVTLSCVGCKRDQEAGRDSGTLHFGIDEKYGETWKSLYAAVMTIGYLSLWRGERRITP